MTEQEDIENFNSYTKPPQLQFSLPYSVELSDIIEEDEPSSRGIERPFTEEERLAFIRKSAEELVKYIEDRIQSYQFEEESSSSGPSTEEFSREFDISPSHKSISLVDLRNIPDLPPSMMLKPKVLRIDKSTSTTEISESISDLSRLIDSGCMTEETTLSTSNERTERVLDKIDSLHRFFSRSRLEIIDESMEENGDKIKTPSDIKKSLSQGDFKDLTAGQASLDDVEDLLDDNDKTERDLIKMDSQTMDDDNQS